MAAEIKPDKTLDTKGMLCPKPVLMTKIEIDQLNSGQILEILATDPAADPDLRAWARRTGNIHLGTEVEGEVTKIYVKKK
jgi:tRNA 2-thiouridine synthesizing protein A